MIEPKSAFSESMLCGGTRSGAEEGLLVFGVYFARGKVSMLTVYQPQATCTNRKNVGNVGIFFGIFNVSGEQLPFVSEKEDYNEFIVYFVFTQISLIIYLMIFGS